MEMRLWEKEVDGETLRVHLIPALKDNYIYLLVWHDQALVIDPSDADPVLALLTQGKLTLKAILNTHHHLDHTGGNVELKQKTGCRLIAPSQEHIEEVDEVISDGEELILGALLIEVIGTPGHTLDHICFYLPDYQMLFSGDILFTGGCGKVFEGTFQAMFDSLCRLAALPPETLLFCGHEMTIANLRFGLSIEPNNADIQQRLAHITDEGEPTVPSTLAMELKTNPFLRTQSPQLRAHLQMEQATPLEVFCKLRELKDEFLDTLG